MGWFGNLVRKGAKVGAKVLGATGTAIKTLGNFTHGAGKFLGMVAPHGQAVAAALGPMGGPDGLVAAAAAHQILQHGPGLLQAVGGTAARIGQHLQGAGGSLKRWAG